jgi:hypothetical protein
MPPQRCGPGRPSPPASRPRTTSGSRQGRWRLPGACAILSAPARIRSPRRSSPGRASRPRRMTWDANIPCRSSRFVRGFTHASGSAASSVPGIGSGGLPWRWRPVVAAAGRSAAARGSAAPALPVRRSALRGAAPRSRAAGPGALPGHRPQLDDGVDQGEFRIRHDFGSCWVLFSRTYPVRSLARVPKTIAARSPGNPSRPTCALALGRISRRGGMQNGCVRFLEAAMRWAAREEMIPPSPVERMSFPPPGAPRSRPGGRTRSARSGAPQGRT